MKFSLKESFLKLAEDVLSSHRSRKGLHGSTLARCLLLDFQSGFLIQEWKTVSVQNLQPGWQSRTGGTLTCQKGDPEAPICPCAEAYFCSFRLTFNSSDVDSHHFFQQSGNVFLCFSVFSLISLNFVLPFCVEHVPLKL